MEKEQCRYPRVNLSSCYLPWTSDFKLDVEVFERHIIDILQKNYKHVYLMGTAGEGYALDDQKYRQVVEIFARHTVKEDIYPQVGVISLSMQEIINRIAFAYDKGIRMFQISMPSWGVLDDLEALLFFKTVCGSFPEARFLHYNLPRAKRIISGTEYHRIALEVPNLVATKNSTYDYNRTADLMLNAPELRHFLLEHNFAMGCTLGECSLICAYSLLFPETGWKFYEAGLKKDLTKLFSVTRFLWEVTRELFGHVSRNIIDGAYDKTFVWLRNPEFSNLLLPPYIGLDEKESQECRKIFEEKYKHIL